MTWDNYSDLLKNAGGLFYGIYSKEGAVCCQSPNMNVSTEEIRKFVKCMAKEETSFKVNGESCIMTRVDDDYIQGKTSKACYDNQKIFYHVESSATMLVLVGMVGVSERDASGIANIAVSALKQVGY